MTVFVSLDSNLFEIVPVPSGPAPQGAVSTDAGTGADSIATSHTLNLIMIINSEVKFLSSEVKL